MPTPTAQSNPNSKLQMQNGSSPNQSGCINVELFFGKKGGFLQVDDCRVWIFPLKNHHFCSSIATTKTYFEGFQREPPNRNIRLPPTQEYPKAFILSLIYHIFFPHAKVNHSFTIIFPLFQNKSLIYNIFPPFQIKSLIYHLFSPHSRTGEPLTPPQFMRLPMSFYFILSSFYSEISPVSVCLSQNPQGMAVALPFRAWGAPPEKAPPMHSGCGSQHWNPALESSKGDSSDWDRQVSSSNSC